MRSSVGNGPQREREDGSPVDLGSPAPTTPSLQLSVTKKGVGLELTEPLRLGVLRVDRAEIALPTLRFPVDLSGGVGRFRHRRGHLLRLDVTADRVALEQHARRRLADVFQDPRVTLVPEPEGVSLGIASEAWALTMRLRWAPLGGDVRFVVEDARAAGLAMPAHEAALIAVSTWVGDLGTRWGSVFTISNGAGRLFQEVLLGTGARLPSMEGLAWGALDHRDGEWRAELGESSPLRGEPTAQTSAAVELATLLGSADHALGFGKREEARAAYLNAWERAPLDAAIARRVAEIDAAEGRPEAGLSILTTTESAVLAGALGGALLAAAGDREGAKEALTRAGETETFAPLGALCLARAASLTDHPGERAELLRGALSRAPTVEALRWPRLAVLLELGDERAAQAEAEGVSAIAPVGRRFEVALRLGKTFLDRGHAAAARLWFERALLFSPRSPEAMVGLGEAMLEGQCFGRATEVLSRASEGLEREGKPRGRALLALARALADGSGELSLAIARVRAVKSDESVAVEARYREGTWLARLGDRAEASLAFLRMLEAEERTPHGSPEHAAAWLAEAARFEREERGDLAIAKRHLGVAIRLRPKDPALLAEFRRAARELEAARTFVPRTPEREPPPSRRDATPRAPLVAPVRRPLELDLSPDASDADDEEGADDAALVDKLTDRLRGDPTNLEISLELAAALERLGRDLDLLGVLSAQIDEGDAETRALFLPLRRSTLERLARNARAEGREGEAELYASMAKA